MRLWLLLLPALIAAAPAPRLEMIRAAKSLSCAVEDRPGFDGPALCRRLALALIGPRATVRSGAPESPQDFAAAARADVVVLSDLSVQEHGLGAAFRAGPVVFVDPITLIVPQSSTIRELTDLPGHSVCLIIGSPAQMALEARMGEARPAIQRLSFSEDVEMLDAYNVGRCDAAVDDASRLGVMMGHRGINNLQSRLLTPPLAETRLRVRTPTGEDDFAAQVEKALSGP